MIAQGTPETIVNEKRSYTGRYLRAVLWMPACFCPCCSTGYTASASAFVVRGTKYANLREAIPPVAYVPSSQLPYPETSRIFSFGIPRPWPK